MAVVTGLVGRVKVGSDTLLNCEGWELNAEKEMLDDTYIGETAEGVVPGLFSADGSLTCAMNYGDTTGQLALHVAFFAGTAVTLVLETNSGGSIMLYTGSAYITKISPKVEKGAKSMLPFSFKFDGVVTFTAS